MKLNGFVGTGSGKLGASVFSTIAGQQVVRQYQPVVANPNTIAQTNQRARLKLGSQLAAALSPVIAIPRNGMQSSRNLFMKLNFKSIYASNGIAQVTYENLQLTNGNAGLPGVAITRTEGVGVTAGLESRADGAVSRVAYAMFKKSADAQLQFIGSAIVEEAGTDGKFPHTFDMESGEIVIFAYGMRDSGATATANYGNYSVRNGEDLARLILTRKLSMSDYQLTKTRCTTLPQGANSAEPVPDGQVRLYVTSGGHGSVSGAGTFAVGTQVTVTATAESGYYFNGWYINGTNTQVSNNASYTFTINEMTDLIARFTANSSSGGDDSYE